MNKSESIAKLAEALSKAQGQIKNAVKDSANPYFKSKYADLASVWDACRNELAANGLAVVQIPAMRDGKVCVTTVLMHSSGEWIDGDLELTPVKSDPQGAGSAITYARRYALAGFAGIAPEDDDGNAASGKAAGAAPRLQNVPRIEEDIPLTPTNGNGDHVLPPAEDRITKEQAAKLHMRFRDSLPEDMKPKADAVLHDWLGQRMLVDEHGNPSALAILKTEYANVGKAAVAFAKELAA